MCKPALTHIYHACDLCHRQLFPIMCTHETLHFHDLFSAGPLLFLFVKRKILFLQLMKAVLDILIEIILPDRRFQVHAVGIQNVPDIQPALFQIPGQHPVEYKQKFPEFIYFTAPGSALLLHKRFPEDQSFLNPFFLYLSLQYGRFVGLRHLRCLTVTNSVFHPLQSLPSVPETVVQHFIVVLYPFPQKTDPPAQGPHRAAHVQSTVFLHILTQSAKRFLHLFLQLFFAFFGREQQDKITFPVLKNFLLLLVFKNLVYDILYGKP